MVWLAVGVASCGGGSSDSPSPATQETVAGIDANGDGVRDDIESYIDTAYPASTQGAVNRALRQFARAAQETMIDASAPAPSVTHAGERFRALECLMAKRPADFHLIFVALRARVLNTLRKLRQMTWAQVYRDAGLKWEKIESVKTPSGIDAVCSPRITQSRRATAYRQGDFMRFLTIQQDHDSTYGKK